ncbi:MAG: aldolase/citrate lyase family protein [Gemmatimonadaceae bacterium]
MLLRLRRALLLLQLAAAPAAAQSHLNPLVDLLAAKKPVFGLYAPSNRRPPVRPGAPTAPEAPPKSAAELAREALGQPGSDYIFDGAMEHDYDAGLASFTEFAKGFWSASPFTTAGARRITHPLVVKTPEIAPDPAKARERIAQQLNLGVSTIVFVGVESADEVKQGLAMMRFPAAGGTRENDVGAAPKLWGLSEAAYRAKADLWPLNPKGELVNWTIVESKAGLAKVREIAAVKGIGVLFPGAGTLRGVFTTTDAAGKRSFDEAGWEAAIQQVLAACKEFNVPCGYPAGLNDIELRMKQGFSVFVIGWGENGFKTVELGRKVAGRAATNAEEWR